MYLVIWVWHQVSICYMGTGFVMLSWTKIYITYSAFGFYLHYVLALGIPVALLLPKRDRRKDAVEPGSKKQTKIE